MLYAVKNSSDYLGHPTQYRIKYLFTNTPLNILPHFNYFSRNTFILFVIEKQETTNHSFLKSIQPWVFFPSAGLIVLFVALTLIYQESISTLFETTQAFIATKFGWLYVMAVNVILLFCIYLGFGRFKNIRLGGSNCKPEFSTWAWLSMLFNAGIGLVLMFYSVAEPIMHYSNPPYGEADTLLAAKNALNISYLHWGLHGWAVYALMGLSIAFFCYNRGLPLGIRWGIVSLAWRSLKRPYRPPHRHNGSSGHHVWTGYHTWIGHSAHQFRHALPIWHR